VSDITSLLERTTPDDLPAPDVRWLAHRSRRRRACRRALLVSVTVVTMVAVGAATGTVLGSDPDRPEVTMPAVGPNGEPLTEPVGSWSRADDPPFSPRVDTFGGTLSDGRVVVWGGNADEGDNPDSSEEIPTGFADGGIFDPDTELWEPIPAAPVPPPTIGGAFTTSAQLVDDRLAVATGSADGSLHAAVYDVAQGRWVDAPPLTEIALVYDAMAWDGETLVLVRSRPGQTGWAGDGQLDWRIDAPITLRWRFGDDRWTTGTRPPFGLRDYVGAAFDGSRLALWGGSDGTSTLNDGAIYAVATDTWTVIPEGPLPGRVHAATAWSAGRLVVGGGLDRLQDPEEYLGDMAAYDAATQTWESLAPPPEGGLGDQFSAWSFVEGETTPLVADSTSGSGEPGPRWFYGPAGWEQAPLGGITDLGGFIVATIGNGNFGSITYELRVRVGPDEWLHAAKAPFNSRMGATTVATPSNKLVVVGGWEGSNLDPKNDAWVFDLAG
jgi:Galactose oxidase, central domain